MKREKKKIIVADQGIDEKKTVGDPWFHCCWGPIAPQRWYAEEE